RQLRTRSPDRRNRPRLDRGRSTTRQPARYPGHVGVNVSGPGRLGRAHLLRCPLTDALRAERTAYPSEIAGLRSGGYAVVASTWAAGPKMSWLRLAGLTAAIALRRTSFGGESRNTFFHA